MNEAYDTSETRQTWRNVFMVSFLVLYTVNLVDVLMSEPETGERTPEESTGGISLEMQGDNVFVYKSFGF
jgi:hypothetical protein